MGITRTYQSWLKCMGLVLLLLKYGSFLLDFSISFLNPLLVSHGKQFLSVLASSRIWTRSGVIHLVHVQVSTLCVYRWLKCAISLHVYSLLFFLLSLQLISSFLLGFMFLVQIFPSPGSWCFLLGLVLLTFLGEIVPNIWFWWISRKISDLFLLGSCLSVSRHTLNHWWSAFLILFFPPLLHLFGFWYDFVIFCLNSDWLFD